MSPVPRHRHRCPQPRPVTFCSKGRTHCRANAWISTTGSILRSALPLSGCKTGSIRWIKAFRLMRGFVIFKAAVLIAEDETVLRSIAVEVLEQCGFFVFAAADGEAALEVLKAHAEIALLISDIQMPRMNGYTLIAAALEFRPELK